MKSLMLSSVLITVVFAPCLAQTPASTEDKAATQPGHGYSARLKQPNESTAQTAPGYSISLTQPTESFTLGSPIKIKMTITNATDHDILWRAVWSKEPHSWYGGFRILLQRSGREVETTFLHRKISGRQRPGDPSEVADADTVLVTKQPGLMFVLTIDLKLLYEIAEPGKYTLEVSRVAEDGKTIVQSNTIALNVVL